MKHVRWRKAALAAALLIGCGGDATESVDAGLVPALTPDAGTVPLDAGTAPDVRPSEGASDAAPMTFPPLPPLPAAEGSCRRLGNEVRLSSGGGRAERPQVIWDDREYIVAWSDAASGNPDIQVTRLNYLGERMGLDEPVARTPDPSRWPALTLRDLGDPVVAWEEGRGDDVRVLVRRLGKDLPATEPVEVARSGLPQARPSLASTARQSFLAWMDRDTGVKLARLTQEGPVDTTVPPVRVGQGRASLPQVGAQRDQVAVAYLEPGGNGTRVRLALFNTNLQPLRDLLVRDHASPAGGLSLTWSGAVWTLSWEDLRTGAEQIYTAQVSPQGALSGPGRLPGDGVTSANWPRMASSGRFTPVVYYAFVSGAEIMVSLVDADARKLGGDLRLSNSPGAARFPDVGYNSRNGQFGIAWEETHETGVPEIRFARVTCSEMPSEPNAQGAAP